MVSDELSSVLWSVSAAAIVSAPDRLQDDSLSARSRDAKNALNAGAADTARRTQLQPFAAVSATLSSTYRLHLTQPAAAAADRVINV